MTNASYELRDPRQVVADAMAERPLNDGDAVVASVREAAGEQAVTRVVPIPASRWRMLDRSERSALLAATAQALPIPERRPGGPPNHSIVTIVARRGLAVFGRSEAEWAIAWHYSNHLVHAYSADLILVTEYGWTDFMSGWGGHEPRLALSGGG